MKIPNPYENKHYRRLFLLPLVLVLLALVFIPRIPQGIELKGGSLLTVFTNADNLEAKATALEKTLSAYSPEVSVRTFQNPSGKGLEIELQSNAGIEAAEGRLAALKTLSQDVTNEQLQLDGLRQNQASDADVQKQQQKVDAALTRAQNEARDVLGLLEVPLPATPLQNPYDFVENALQEKKTAFRTQVLEEVKKVVPVTSFSSKEIGSALSKFFFGQVTQILFYSFLASSIVIILVFRDFVPSLAVLFGAFCDVVVTLGVMGLIGIPLSLATVAARLMLVGFSLDTDMLLTIRVLKRTEGTAKQRAFDTFKTATLMNACTVAAFSVLVIVANILQIQTYQQIGMVAIIGALVDFIATWAGNAVMVLWHAQERGMA